MPARSLLVMAAGFLIAAVPTRFGPLRACGGHHTDIADRGPRIADSGTRTADCGSPQAGAIHTPQSALRNLESALVGRVSSVGEGPMEGVLVSARKAGSTITTTVVSDRQGEYRFPHARLEPGRYALRIRAVGFDLDGEVSVDVAAHNTATADLKLRQARDVASQLSNA